MWDIFKRPEMRSTVMIVAVVLALALMSRLFAVDTSTPEKSTYLARQVKRFINQSSAWHRTAIQNITDPTMKLVHANYALAYTHAARALMPSDADIEKLTRIKVSELLYALEQDQKLALQQMVQKCPQLHTAGIFTTGNAWM